GLLLIGIKYAFFWGFLAAFLAIVPYIGTFIGGFLPFAYAMATSDSYVQPALVVLLFGTVQVLEGNIITPKVVGSSVKINPLAAILALVTGGFIWGIGGLILAIPIIAILRVVMAEIDFLKPLSALLSSDIYENEEIFEEKFDKEQFRIWHFFRKRKVNG
ncbi:MAG: AI-2E family transporter, partial [Bacteroidota bacterium]